MSESTAPSAEIARLSIDQHTYHYCDLSGIFAQRPELAQLPYSLKVLLENILRQHCKPGKEANETRSLPKTAWQPFVEWIQKKGQAPSEMAYHPARVLLQDFTGVPAVVDLAAMRDVLKEWQGDPARINPRIPVDLVIDHSVQVNQHGHPGAFEANTALEVQRNRERYELLKWAGQKGFRNVQIIPPGTGICHQVNLEYLSQVVFVDKASPCAMLYPDTVIGTDSHTTMSNALGVLSWGVGGIEAETAMLGLPISMLIPEVIGVRLSGQLPAGCTATDLVLYITEMLRKAGVVGKFVEYCGPGLDTLSIPDRATLSNMSPEYGATAGFFPIDQLTLDYLELSGREAHHIRCVEAYAKAQQLWRDAQSPEPHFTQLLEVDLSTIEPCIAGPKRPQERVSLARAPQAFALHGSYQENLQKSVKTPEGYTVEDGHVVIAAITSCTNTSNPYVMLAAGLLAQKAVEKGLRVPPWVKCSLAPGSKVVTEYLAANDLQRPLDALGFQLVGYGCTTCIGNSGPLIPAVSEAVRDQDLTVCAVLSGNRNFEGRIHPQVLASWLASPPLVVAYALAGSLKVNLATDPIGQAEDGTPVYLKDIWPAHKAIEQAIQRIDRKMFCETYQDVFSGDEAIQTPQSLQYQWQDTSTYIRSPSFLRDIPLEPQEALMNIEGAYTLAVLGDSITTDHISPGEPFSG